MKAAKPKRIDQIVVSHQHKEGFNHSHQGPVKAAAKEVLGDLVDKNTVWHINPTGNFVIGGPDGDTGLTGRKIIVDTYGGFAPHGGGAFSGKDPTKVDRSAAYMARWLAKNVVADNMADWCSIQLKLCNWCKRTYKYLRRFIMDITDQFKSILKTILI